MSYGLEIDYDVLPEYMRDGARAHIEEGRPVGHFLSAVLENDFAGAVIVADDVNLANLRWWAWFLYNEAPPDSWGSPEKVKAWRRQGGLKGAKR